MLCVTRKFIEMLTIVMQPKYAAVEAIAAIKKS